MEFRIANTFTDSLAPLTAHQRDINRPPHSHSKHQRHLQPVVVVTIELFSARSIFIVRSTVIFI